jgi:hypothetical protein
VNPGGGSGWDEAPLGIQIPDDARELDRDVLAYHRELRAQRRRNRLRRLTSPFSGPGTVMPLLASILAVCLVAGAMLSVATFSPSTAPADHPTRPAVSAPAATHSSASAASTTPATPASPFSTAPPSPGASSAASRGSHSPGSSAAPSRPAGQPDPSGSGSRLAGATSSGAPGQLRAPGPLRFSPTTGSESRRP